MSKRRAPETPSVLMAMHRRYEQALAEYEIIDTAHQTATDDGDTGPMASCRRPLI